MFRLAVVTVGGLVVCSLVSIEFATPPEEPEVSRRPLQLIFLWGSTLVAACATFALRSLPTQRVNEKEQLTGFHGVFRKSWLQVRAHYDG